MSDSIKRIISSMQSLEDNQDGTLKGGFVSVSGRRFRLIFTGVEDVEVSSSIDWDPLKHGYHTHNKSCEWKDRIIGIPNDSCMNDVCGGSTNTFVPYGGNSCRNIKC